MYPNIHNSSIKKNCIIMKPHLFSNLLSNVHKTIKEALHK